MMLFTALGMIIHTSKKEFPNTENIFTVEKMGKLALLMKIIM